jgi:hypothetical protein
MRLERGATPPASAITQPQIAQAVAAWEAARDQAKLADRELVKLERAGRAAAEAEDAKATAQAIATNGKDPGNRAVARYEKALTDARRQAAAGVIVEQTKWQQVQAEFGAHGDELREGAEVAIEESRVQYLRAVDQLEQAHDRLARLLPWQVFFAASGTGNGTYRSVQRPESVLLAPERHALDPSRVTMSSVLVSLRSIGAPPPSTETEDVMPLEPRHRPLSEQGVTASIGAPGLSVIEP